MLILAAAANPEQPANGSYAVGRRAHYFKQVAFREIFVVFINPRLDPLSAEGEGNHHNPTVDAAYPRSEVVEVVDFKFDCLMVFKRRWRKIFGRSVVFKKSCNDSFLCFRLRGNNKNMSDEFIQSRQNPRIKHLLRLRDRAGRRKTGLFVVEGLRELSRCAETVGVDEIYYCPEFFKSSGHSPFVEKIRAEGKIPLCRLSESAFEKISNREGCDGIIGIAKQWDCSLADIDISEVQNPTILVADSIEKPGNLGALIRSADSLGAAAVILTNSVSDIFNPAVARASQGAVFSVQIATASPAEASEWLKRRNISAFGAHLGAKDCLWGADMSKPCAIVVGSEKDGLGDESQNTHERTFRQHERKRCGRGFPVRSVKTEI